MIRRGLHILERQADLKVRLYIRGNVSPSGWRPSSVERNAIRDPSGAARGNDVLCATPHRRLVAASPGAVERSQSVRRTASSRSAAIQVFHSSERLCPPNSSPVPDPRDRIDANNPARCAIQAGVVAENP